jgi:hypothetical protein
MLYMKYGLKVVCLLLLAGGLSAQKKYDQGSRFMRGFARIVDNGHSFYVDRSGQKAFDTIYTGRLLAETGYDLEDTVYLTQDIVEVGLNGKMGVLTTDGKWLLKPIYDTVDTQSREQWMVRKDNKTSYYTTMGFLLPFRFEDMENLDNHYFAVKEQGKWGVYNKDLDQVIVPSTYEEIDYCYGCTQKGNYLLAKKDGKWGVVNFKNEVLVPFKYDHEHMNMRSDEWVESFYEHDQKLSINIKTGKVDIDTCECLPDETTANLDYPYGRFQLQRRNGKWGMVNGAGNVILKHQYDDISYEEGDDLVGIQVNGKVGVADTLGKIIIPMAYDDWFKDMCDGKLVRSEQKGQEVIFSVDGKRVLPQYNHFNELQLGDGTKLLSIKYRNLWGFYNPDNGKLVPPKYTELGYFNDRQYIIVYNGRKGGFLDKNGNQVVPGGWDNIEGHVFKGQDHLARVTLNDKTGVYDIRQQKLVIPVVYDYISATKDSSLLELTKGSLYGLADFSGKLIRAPKYSSIIPVDSIYYALQVTDTSRIEILNRVTMQAYTIPYDTIRYTLEGTVMHARENNVSFLYDAGKKAIIEGDYSKGGYPEAISYFNNHVCKVWKNKKVGFMDARGNFVIQPQYDYASEIIRGVIAVFTLVDSVDHRYKYGFIDSSGKQLTPIIYDVPAELESSYTDEAFINEEDGVLVLMREGYVGYARLDGSIVVPPIYDEVSADKDKNGYLVKLKSKYGILGYNGKPILKTEYDDVLLDEEKGYHVNVAFQFPILARKNGQWRYMDEQGRSLGLTVGEYVSFAPTDDWGAYPVMVDPPLPPVANP